MADEPDLMAELDDAERIISGEAEEIVTEWGIRYDGKPGCPVMPLSGEKVARTAAGYRGDRLGERVTVVRRKVTYGEWRDG